MYVRVTVDGMWLGYGWTMTVLGLLGHNLTFYQSEERVHS